MSTIWAGSDELALGLGTLCTRSTEGGWETCAWIESKLSSPAVLEPRFAARLLRFSMLPTRQFFWFGVDHVTLRARNSGGAQVQVKFRRGAQRLRSVCQGGRILRESAEGA